MYCACIVHVLCEPRAPTVGFHPSDAFSAVMRQATTWPLVRSKGFCVDGLLTSMMKGMIGLLGASVVPSILVRSTPVHQ